MGGQGRPIPFPFNQGLIAKTGEAAKLPQGSPERQRAIQQAMMMPIMGMSMGVSSTPRIHAEDQNIMQKVIDYARLRQPYNQPLELAASDILEHYNLKPSGTQPKTMGQVANVFDKVLTVMRHQK